MRFKLGKVYKVKKFPDFPSLEGSLFRVLLEATLKNGGGIIISAQFLEPVVVEGKTHTGINFRPYELVATEVNDPYAMVNRPTTKHLNSLIGKKVLFYTNVDGKTIQHKGELMKTQDNSSEGVDLYKNAGKGYFFTYRGEDHPDGPYSDLVRVSKITQIKEVPAESK